MIANGSITINGISDSELVLILDFKIKHEGKFTFNPQQLQVARAAQPDLETLYNNAIFSWPNEQGLQVIHEIIGKLLKKEEHATAVGQ